MKNVTISTEVKYKNVIILTEGQAFSLKTGISFWKDLIVFGLTKSSMQIKTALALKFHYFRYLILTLKFSNTVHVIWI